jgi:hypothetical protein
LHQTVFYFFHSSFLTTAFRTTHSQLFQKPQHNQTHPKLFRNTYSKRGWIILDKKEDVFLLIGQTSLSKSKVHSLDTEKETLSAIPILAARALAASPVAAAPNP